MDVMSLQGFEHDVLCAEQYSRERLDYLFARTDQIKAALKQNKRALLRSNYGWVVVGWFRQQSTRTNLSFQIAAARMGMTPIFFSDIRNISSEYKGEEEDHSWRMIAGYEPDILIIRHERTGGVMEAARRARLINPDIRIINAGDGKGQHPTQAKIDVKSIRREHGVGPEQDISHLVFIIGGDLQGRAARSLAIMLALYQPKLIIFVSPPELRMGDDIKRYLRERRVAFEEETDLARAFPYAHGAYWTRTQNDQRTEEEINLLGHIDQIKFQVQPVHLERARPDFKLFHPLPIERRPEKITEIHPAIDDMPQAAYWPQAWEGPPLRMAVLEECAHSQLH